MRSRKLIVTLIVVVVLLLLILPKLSKKNEQLPPKAAGPAGPIPVKGMVIKGENLNNMLRVTGSLLANEEVNLQPEASGKVMRIFFQEGKTVHKGQLLLKLNDAELQAQLPKAESKLALARDMEQRQKKLLEREGISQSEYEVSANETRAARAEVEQLKEQIRKTEIIAPFDGTIGLKYVSEGAYVSPGTRIATLRNISRIKIEFTVSEKYISHLHQGKKVRFDVQNSAKTYEAEIYAVEPGIDPMLRSVMVRAVCNNDGKLFPGAFANVSIPLDEEKGAILIPTESVVPVLKGQKVYIASADTVREQLIGIGSRSDKAVHVTKGLKEGDTLITSSIMQLRQGSRIKVKLSP
jgi:membrane fusion protein, multidrug efflux system